MTMMLLLYIVVAANQSTAGVAAATDLELCLPLFHAVAVAASIDPRKNQ